MKIAEDIKTLQAEAILRLNCPGIGQSYSLKRGDAPPLNEYSVIIVNPVSIVHLFGEDPAIGRQVDMAQADGMSSCKLADGTIIERIGQHIEYRSPELFSFLAEGGLLIYFLCRPFVVTDTIRSMDNYAWLCGLAPDQSGEATMSEQTVRHMSSVAHGHNIDRLPATELSSFNTYFNQVGLEWNTVIRTDFLTSGYSPLALAGPKKCIAGELIAGDNGGRVVFLPAPYSPDFDRVLIECINHWYAEKMGFDQAFLEAQQAQSASAQNTDSSVSVQVGSAQENLPQLGTEVVAGAAGYNSRVPGNGNGSSDSAVSKISGQSIEVEREHAGTGKDSLSSQKITSDISKANDASSDEKFARHNARLTGQEMQPVFNAESVTDWAKSYWLPGIDGLFKEIQLMQKQIRDLEKKLAINEDAISSLEAVKSTLLSGQPGDLLASCKVVLDNLGWRTESDPKHPSDIVLIDSDAQAALAHVTISRGSAERTELARLTEALINFWDNNGSEPKGILIACAYCDTPISQRKEPEFPEVMVEFARKKNICLISTTQLISIYLDEKLGKVQAKSVREAILSTSGRLSGFAL